MKQTRQLGTKRQRLGKTWATTGLIAGGLLLGSAGTLTAQAQTATADGDATRDDVAQTTAQPVTAQSQVTLGQQPAATSGTLAPAETPDAADPTPAPANEATQDPETTDSVDPVQPDKASAPKQAATPETDDSDASVVDRAAAPVSDEPEQDPTPAAGEATDSQVPGADAIVPHKAVKDAATIDDWMPDRNLQQFVLWQLQQDGQTIQNVSEITPDMVQNMTKLTADASLEATDEAYFKMVTGIQNLKGLEGATKLANLTITPFSSANRKWTGSEGTHGALSDVSALSNLDSLRQVSLGTQNLSDIAGLQKSAQAANDSGGFAVWNLGANHIYDVRPLMVTNKAQWFMISMNDQTLTLPEVTLNPNTTEFVTSSPWYSKVRYDITDARTNNKLIGPLTRNQGSTADGRVIGDQRYISWTNFDGPTGQLVYTLDQRPGGYDDVPLEPFDWKGTVTVPYRLVADTGTLAVNFKYVHAVQQDYDDYGDTLAPDVAVSGTTGSDYDVLGAQNVQQTIQLLKNKGFGYIGTANEQATTGQYGADASRIILLFGYKQTIHLVDEQGQPIGAQPADAVGDVDQTWQQDVGPIAGYTYDHATGTTPTVDAQTGALTLSGTLTENNPDIYVYFKEAAAQQLVNFVDGDHQALAAPVTVSGQAGTTQTVTLPSVDGYVVDHATAGTVTGDQLSIVLAQGAAPINVVYRLAEYQQAVNFVDGAGKTLAPATTVTGTAGSLQTVDLPSVDGYEVDHATAGTVVNQQLNVTISKDETPINIVYRLAEYQQAVNFVDETGKTLAPAMAVKGTAGSTQVLTLPAIDGYAVVSATAGTLADNQLTVVMSKTTAPINVLFKKLIAKGQVTVKYQDLSQQSLAPDQVLTGEVGQAYTTTPSQQVTGDYELIVTPMNAHGTFAKTPQTVVYIYRLIQQGGGGATVDPELPDGPDQPETPEQPENPGQPEQPEQPVTPEHPGTSKQPTTSVQAGDTATSQSGDAATLLGNGAAATGRRQQTPAVNAHPGHQADRIAQPLAAATTQPGEPQTVAAHSGTSVTTQLPQTNEQAPATLQIIGMALLGSLVSAAGWLMGRRQR